EIWKEIVSVKAPTPSAQDKLEKAPAVSPEVAVFAEERRSRLIASVAFSSIVGLLIALLAEFPLAFFLISVIALVACSFAKTEWPRAGKTQKLLKNQQDPPDDPFVRKLWNARWSADRKVRQIEVRWEKEAGEEGFLTRLDDLRSRKETYENLPKFRRFKIQ